MLRVFDCSWESRRYIHTYIHTCKCKNVSTTYIWLHSNWQDIGALKSLILFLRIRTLWFIVIFCFLFGFLTLTTYKTKWSSSHLHTYIHMDLFNKFIQLKSILVHLADVDEAGGKNQQKINFFLCFKCQSCVPSRKPQNINKTENKTKKLRLRNLLQNLANKCPSGWRFTLQALFRHLKQKCIRISKP